MTANTAAATAECANSPPTTDSANSTVSAGEYWFIWCQNPSRSSERFRS